jgi:hypothetical protein
MGFGIESNGDRMRAKVTCDAPGCGAEVDWAEEGFAITGGEGALLIACGERCRDRLLSAPNAGCVGLDDFLRSVVLQLVDVDIDDEELDAPDPHHLAAVLTELEAMAAAPGIPAHTSVRKAIEDGYIGAHHVARAWSA